jgi:hypothetical protein
MTDFDERNNPKKPQDRWRNENPSSGPLKLALLAAAIICIIAIVIYLKARHRPPALRDMLQSQPASHPTGRPTPGSLRAETHSISLPSSKS